MIVKELIDKLKECNPDAIVTQFDYEYGNDEKHIRHIESTTGQPIEVSDKIRIV